MTRLTVSRLALLHCIIVLCIVIPIDRVLSVETKSVRLKVMTYNIRIGKGGGDWNADPAKVDLEPVARIIEGQKPDIIGLEEVDRFRKRTALMNQPDLISKRLKMNVAYEPAYTVPGPAQSEEYGNALLSRFEIKHSERFALFKPDYSKTRPDYPDYYSEQRALLHGTVDLNGIEVHIFVTHLGLTADQRQRQIVEIIEFTDRYKGPKILIGDFNAFPEEPAMKMLLRHFQDALTEAKVKPERRLSYPAGSNPTEAIDYIFVSRDFRVINASVLRDQTLASDHNPVVAEVELLSKK